MAGTTRSFAIPAQSMAGALSAFGLQSGLQVTADASVLAGLNSPGASGTLDRDVALQRLLAGSGLTFLYAGADTVVVERPPSVAQGAATLPTVQVQGAPVAESPYGPGQGFVAHQSATGTKTDTPLIETPQAISVVTRDQMNAQAVQSVADSLRYTSGVQVSPLGAQNKDTFYVRGFGESDGGGVQYLDGMKLPYGSGFAQPQIDPSSLDRVEVVHGPASVLYGQNSPGGFINMISKRPTDEPIHEVTVQGGSYHNYQGTFDLGGKLTKDGQFLYRLNGLARTNDTQFHHNRQQRVAISPALTWRPNENTTLTFLTNYQHDDPGGRFYNLVPAAGSAQPNPHGQISSRFSDADSDYNKFERTQYSVGYLLEHRFSDAWTVRQNLRYLHVDGKYRDVFSAGLEPDYETLDRYSRFNEEHLGTFTVDNQAQAKFSTGPVDHTFLFGIDYRNINDDNRVGLGIAPSMNLFSGASSNEPISDPSIYSNTKQVLSQTGLYGQDQIRWGKWAFLLGGRVDKADSSIDNRLSNSSSKDSSSAFTWRTGLVYLFDNGLAPYVSYSTSFYPTAGTNFAGNSFKPTKGKQYEAGIKYQPPGYNSFITASAFILTQKNVLTSDPDPTHLGYSVQEGEVRSRGIELEGHASLTNNLNLIGTYTYLNARVTKSNSGTKNKTPLYMPRHSASAWLDYTMPTGLFEGLRMGGGVRFVSSTFGDSSNTFKVQGYEVVDAALRYNLKKIDPRLNGWTLGVNVNNLLDKKYVAGCGSAYACYYGNRRTVLGSLSVVW